MADNTQQTLSGDITRTEATSTGVNPIMYTLCEFQLTVNAVKQANSYHRPVT